MKPSSTPESPLKLVESATPTAKVDSKVGQESVSIEDASSVERALILGAQVQDKAAFKGLYEMHMPRVYALCCRLCADRSQAEDATQEVFIQLWRKIQNFKGDSQFSTWLHSVAANVTVSYIRKQRGWWQRMTNIEDSSVAEREAESSIADTDFEKLVYRLPERARMVFVLHAVEGYRHDQVADMLSIAVGTSKAQFHRARQLIEEWIDE